MSPEKESEPQGTPTDMQVKEDGESEGHPVIGRIEAERKQHRLTRERADFHLVFLDEKIWLTDKGDKADDSRSTCWCGLPD